MNDVAAGTVGEIVYQGPLVMKGYWNNPVIPRKLSTAGGSIPATWSAG